MSITAFGALVFFGLAVFGMFIGFFRGWKKSLVRTCILLSIFLISIFLTPAISSLIVDKFMTGSKISIFSNTFDIEELIGNKVENTDLADILGEGSVTNKLAISIAHIIINFAIFAVVFIILEILSLIIYWIVCIVLKVKGRDEEKEETNEPPLSRGAYIGLRFLGAFIGFVGSVIISLIALTPLFGVMNVCNGLIQNESKSKTEQTASAAVAPNYMAAGLYYTEDEKIGEIEGYIEKYAKIKKSYDKSFVGRFYKYTGLNKIGTKVFRKLTVVKHDGLKLDFTSEFIVITKTYNNFKDVFIKDKVDISNNEDIDNVVGLYDTAVESEIVKEYIVEIFPKIVDKWSKEESFIGIKNPISGDWKETANATMVIFKVDNINRISNNFKAITNVIKVANNYDVIDDINHKVKVEDILKENETFVYDEILVLSSTTELRENISVILNEAFEVLYKEVVGEDIEFENNGLTLTEIAEINKNMGWKTEAENIQATVNNLFEVYDTIQKDSSSEALADKLEMVGAAIDSARESKLITKPFKTFIYGFVEKKVNVKENVRTELLENINTKWNDETFSYKKTFRTIQEASIVAKDIVGGENASLDNLAPAIKDIINDEGSKEIVADLIEKDIITDMVGEKDKDTAEVLSDVLETFVTSEKVTNETIDTDIQAGQRVVDVVNGVKNNGGDIGLGEGEEERKAAADSLVADLVASEGMMETLAESANSTDGSAITDFTKNVKAEDKATINESINSSNTSDANKEILKKLFGII